MKKIRIGNDISIAWTLKSGEEAYSLAGRRFEIRMFVSGNMIAVASPSVSGNVVSFIFRGKDQRLTGTYSLLYVENPGQNEMVAFDERVAFELVSHSWQTGGKNKEGIRAESVEITSSLSTNAPTYDEIIAALGYVPDENVIEAITVNGTPVPPDAGKAVNIVIPDASGKADKVSGAIPGHIATLDSSGNLVDSGKGISDINPLWGNIQGSIENQTDLMDTLNAKQEIFWATYGTTTASEISAAISAGKFVIVNGSHGQAYYWITTPVDIYFWGIAGISVFYYIVHISDNSWSSNSKIIPEEQVNSDWNASFGKAQILNKPDLSTKAEKALTQAYSYGVTAPSDPKEGDIWVSETLTEIPISENAGELTFTKTASRYKLQLEGLTGNDSAVFEWARASDSEPFNSADYKPDGTYYFDAPDYEIEDNELYLSLTYTDDLWKVATLWAVANTVYQYHNGSWVAMEVVTATEKAAWNAKYSKPSGGIPAADIAAGVIPDISGKADAATTLAGYGITDAYTKTEVDGKVSSAYKAAGTVASVASLGTLDAAHEGFVYNMSASFTTTSDFVEGSGTTYPAGTNVAIVNTGTTSSPVYKYDVLAGFVDISGKADKSEMSVVDGTDANADKTTITLKSGTSATVLKSHQDISGKADKVSNATNGNFAALDANGNLTDSGHKHSDYLTAHQDISGKADKVSNATNGHLAALDSNGNLTDSGKSASDFATAAQGAKADAAQPAITAVNVSVDNNTGTPSGSASISGGTLSLSFANLKGATGPQGQQGNTGASVDYPYELVNNLTTDDATKGLSAAQGVVLDDKISQLGQKVGEAEHLARVSENGFFIVDSEMNIVLKVDERGAHAMNLLEYEIVEI